MTTRSGRKCRSCCRQRDRTEPNPRAALGDILFVLRHNLAWNKLPRALGFGCGSACRKRLGEWHAVGVWEEAPRRLACPPARRPPNRLVTPRRGRQQPAGTQKGEHTGPNPTDRARAGSKHHRLTDAGGIPLAASTSAANRNGVTMLLPLLAAVPTVRGRRGRPRRRPRDIYTDRAYRSRAHPRALAARGIRLHVAPPGSGLGTKRWVVERTLVPHEEEVSFANGPTRLAGTPVLPAGPGPHPAVVFVHGDGATARDCLGYYRPLWAAFAAAGFACLSWDKPGVGASLGADGRPYDREQPESSFQRASELRQALDFLKARPDVDGRRIGSWAIS